MSIDSIKLTVASAKGNKAAELFAQALANGDIRRYVKYGVVKARPAIEDEIVITIVKGKEETRNKAKKDDMVVMNPSNEQYIIDAKKFAARYTKDDKLDKTWTLYEAKGECFGFRYKGPSFKFTAPWGELMLVENGDMIVSTSPEGGNDIYRIEKDAFKSTYKLAGG